MFHYGKNPKGDLEVSVSGEDIRMFYLAVSDSGLLSRRDMYPFKTYIEENFRDELGMSNPVSEGPDKGKEEEDGNRQDVQG